MNPELPTPALHRRYLSPTRRKLTVLLITNVFLVTIVIVTIFGIRYHKSNQDIRSRAKNDETIQLRDQGNKNKDPEFVQNEILIKLKKDAKSKIKTGNPEDTGIAELNKTFTKHKVKKFEKVFRQTKLPPDSDLNLWFKITIEVNERIQTTEPLTLHQFQLLKKEFKKDTNIDTIEPNYLANIDQTSFPTPTPPPRPSLSPVPSPYPTTIFTPTPHPTISYPPSPVPSSILPTPTPIVSPGTLPNDPFLVSSGSWGQLYDDLWGVKKIKAQNAWNLSQGEGVVVAVIDTGVDRTHADLSSNLWTNSLEQPDNHSDDDGNGYIDDYLGWDFITSDGSLEDNDPTDDHGHGTHVSGTIAAVGNNAQGIIGIAPRAKIMALKGLNSGGSGSFEDLSRAILYAADNGATIINASWGSSIPKIEDRPQFLADVINYVHDVKAVTFIAAAGNNSSDMSNFYPANYRNVMAISASDHFDNPADFSNYGVQIDVTAPGGDSNSPTDNYYNNILSLRAVNTGMGGDNSLIVANNYYRARGTSMASPHAAGTAALIKSLHSNWSPEQIRQALRISADDTYNPGFDQFAGYGRINAGKAIEVPEPLVARLTSPNGESTSNDTISITGYAYGNNFSSWRLDYGLGQAPNTWSQITSSNQPILSETSLTTWDVSQLPDGLYTIRIKAVNNLGIGFEDRTSVTFKRIYLTHPQFFDSYTVDPGLFRGGDPISFIGTVAIPNFNHYSIAVVNDRGIAIPAKINLTNNGQQKIRDGLLATWDTSGVVTDRYHLNLIAYANDGTNYQFAATALIDSSLHPGWPQNIGTVTWGNLTLSVHSHSNTSDVDRDGKAEILFGYGDKVRIMDHTGNNLPGWPQSIDPDQRGSLVTGSPAAADINNDGEIEIVAITAPYLFAWRTNGTLLPGFPKNILHSYNICSQVILEDIDMNQSKEILFAECGEFARGFLYALDSDGNNLSGWPKVIPYMGNPGELNISDLNRDGQNEIIFTDIPFLNTQQSKLYIIKNDGSMFDGWPKTADSSIGVYVGTPITLDLDQDQDLEIIVLASNNKIYAYHHDGTTVTGWPETTASEPSTLIAGDFNGDNQPEIIAGDSLDTIYVWDAIGQPLTGWPITLSGMRIWNNSNIIGLSLADIDNDKKNDLIVQDYLYNPLTAYKYTGTVISDFPKPSFHDYAGSPAVADIDGDGLVELVTIDRYANAVVYDLPGSKNYQPLSWPMWARNAQHTWNLNLPACDQIDHRIEFSLKSRCDSLAYDAIADLNHDKIVDAADFAVLATNRNHLICQQYLDSTYNPCDPSSPTPTPAVNFSDLDLDLDIDAVDLLRFLPNYGWQATDIDPDNNADFNRNGSVDVFDFHQYPLNLPAR